MKVPHCAHCGQIVRLKPGTYHHTGGVIVHGSCLSNWYWAKKGKEPAWQQLELFKDVINKRY